MKLTHKKLNYKDAGTEYLSSIQCAILLDPICTVIENFLSKSYIVPKVDHTPTPSLSVMFTLKDRFSIVFYTNTHNGQSMNYEIHKCMGIRLILKFGTTAV